MKQAGYMLLITSLLVAAPIPALSQKAASIFPPHAFQDLESFRAGLPAMFSSFLREAGEDSIFDKPDRDLSARLIIRTSFQGDIIVRIEGSRLGGWAYFKRYHSRRTDKSLRAVAQGRHAIRGEEIESLRSFLSKTENWSKASEEDYLLSDGSIWLVEVKDGANYHVATRSSPLDGLVHDLGTRMLHTANVNFETD